VIHPYFYNLHARFDFRSTIFNRRTKLIRCNNPVSSYPSDNTERKSREHAHRRRIQAMHTAKRKAALLIEIIHGKTTVTEPSCAFALICSLRKLRSSLMKTRLRERPTDVREQYERQIKETQEAYGETMMGLHTRKNWRPCWRGRDVIETIRERLQEEGFIVSISKLSKWFDATLDGALQVA
jgi:hypothetical protein